VILGETVAKEMSPSPPTSGTVALPVDAAVYLVHRAVQGHARESFVSRDDFLVCQMEALGAAREAFNMACRHAVCSRGIVRGRAPPL